MSEHPEARDLPLGFMMALAGNAAAMQHYAGLQPQAQKAVAAQAAQAKSREQMQEIVSKLAQNMAYFP